MRLAVSLGFFSLLALACASEEEPDGGVADTGAADTGAPPADTGVGDSGAPDTGVVDLGPNDTGAADLGLTDATEADATEPDATEADATEADATEPDATEPDVGPADTGIDPCLGDPCFPGVVCQAGGGGFVCGPCPSGLEGDGQTCTEIDGCAGNPCLVGSTCTDVPAPGTGQICTPCVGPTCPIFRAQAGPDQQILAGTVATLSGSAVDANGSYTCVWSNDQDATTWTTCTATVAPTVATRYTLTVTDAASQVATDDLLITIAQLLAEAGADQNLQTGDTGLLSASWSGASCPDGSCITCEWRLSNGTVVASTCDAPVNPTATTQYFLTVTDTGTNRTAADSVTLFIIDQPAQLCGWNVVVMTSDEYPSSPNPNYICDPSGTARRQTINGKPAIVLSDLVVQNVRITGHISVETTSDDDLIGFLWGWQNPKHAYLLSWKQLNQNWTPRCGNAPAGVAIKKIDGAPASPSTIGFNSAFGFNATDYAYSCAVGWSQDRANAALLNDSTIFLMTPADVGGHTGGWIDNTTYRFEFYYTPDRTRILIYEDDLQTGSTANLVTSLLVEDSSYPAGAFAFFSNSQEQVQFGDFVLASLADYRADAGADQTITLGSSATLNGQAVLAVPPYACVWSDGVMTLAGGCTPTVTPTADTTYTLTVTDDFGRVATDQVELFVAP